jgi:hypothetical protein
MTAVQEVRAQAELLSGADRDDLLLKAYQCEAAAKVDTAVEKAGLARSVKATRYGSHREPAKRARRIFGVG